jgi:hypothetical protein
VRMSVSPDTAVATGETVGVTEPLFPRVMTAGIRVEF